MANIREEAFSKAKDGHNLLITGQCGTGKTHMLKKIVKDLIPTCRVAVTATTGMASLQLGSNATTLHHWAGIVDGRYTHQKLAELLDSDDQFAAAKKRVIDTECLVIDEISMLSLKIFEMVEFVCRHVKQNNQLFGGIQVIGCGDFKQLPPVPNHRYGDDGRYCFESSRFDLSFAHHINLTEVVRQHEPSLILAVNELCDGMPSDDTIAFLRSLDRPLPSTIQSSQVTRLFGTNFDASYVNHEMLEEMDGELFTFKSKDEGNIKLLRGAVAPKTLLLKEGAKVILIKNLNSELCNGLQGTVQSLQKGGPPVINFHGKHVTLSPARFDVFDTTQQKSLACRTQFPIILSFALTVHRAQGQTLQYLEVDCHSFFAPGQMGVAVGRATTSDNLRIINFNNSAASRKHSTIVYDFYEKQFPDFLINLSCCKHYVEQSDVECQISSTSCINEEPVVSHVEAINTAELPYLESLWDLSEFYTENKSALFIEDVSQEFFNSSTVKNHVNFLYYHVNNIICCNPKDSKGWISAFSKLNTFILSDEHTLSIQSLFGVDSINKFQNKLSTKLVFWLMDKAIKKKANLITDKQKEKIIESSSLSTPESEHAELSSAYKSKIMYLAGACVQKITKRLKESVFRKLGQCSKKSQIAKKFDYKKQALIKQFRINESEVDKNDDSMNEIEFKQGQTRGLTIINDSVFDFFVNLNAVLQQQLSPENTHLYFEQLHQNCRYSVDNDDKLMVEWLSLFDTNDNSDEIEDELFLTLILELFRDITEYFIRIAFVDSLKNFKRTVPRKKKQALRTKIQALGDREPTTSNAQTSKGKRSASSISSVSTAKKPTLDVSDNETYFCNFCKLEIDEEPAEITDQSIGCDKCNCWFHYKCVNLKGNESFLNKDSSKWFCMNCSKKGKGPKKVKKK